MYPGVEKKIDEMRRLCFQHRVQRLSLFGSAVTEQFDSERSDLDFLVEFQPMSPAEHAEHYFGLMEDLESLFSKKVDLVELKPIRNPYFLKAIEGSKVDIYNAA